MIQATNREDMVKDEMLDRPLLSIVTPCYNGEKHLRAAAQSVLDQSYTKFEYIIVNNASTDRTGEIADEIAASDPRVRVVHNTELLPIMQNWNFAMRQISADSAFVTMLCADDVLYPEFLERMYEAGSSSDRIGVIGCYRLEGRNVAPQFTGLLPEVSSGRRVCRANLRMDYRMFCCPSAMMYRASLVREAERFFDEDYIHSDVRVCYELLQDNDFAFCQRVLVALALHDATVSAQIVDRKGTNELERLMMTQQFGPHFFSPAELKPLLKIIERKYYRDMASRMIVQDRKELLKFHRQRWEETGGRFSHLLLFREMTRAFFGRLVDVKRAIKDVAVPFNTTSMEAFRDVVEPAEDIELNKQESFALSKGTN